MYHRIKEMYLYYYPFSLRTCRENAGTAVALILVIGILGSLFLFLREGGYRTVAFSGFFLYFVYREVFYLLKGREAKKAKEIFCRVLMNTGHQYYRSRQVAEAVYDAAEGMPLDTKKNLRRIYEILGAKDRQSGIEEYKRKVKNRYYRVFLMQIAAVEEHGDEERKEGEGGSVFLWNLGNLRMEAELAQRNEQRMRYLLSGLGFVVAVPMFTIPAIHRWAVGNLPELSSFYDGIAGRSLELSVYAISFLLYEFLNGLRGIPYRPVFSAWIRWLSHLKNLQEIFTRFYQARKKHFEKRAALLKKQGDTRTLFEFFLHQLFGAFSGALIGLCLYLMYLRYGVGTNPIWIVLFILAVVLGREYPVLRLNMERLICLDKREEEVLRLEFLIRLEKQLPGITSLELLEDLEQNAQLFRNSLRECIGDYGTDENEALLCLWQKEDYPPFRKLVDMFVMAEEIGVEDAFEEIDAEIEQFLENQKLETEIMQQRRADFAVLLACIPGVFLMFGYLIFPFMAECFRMLEYYNGSLLAG
jgi:hypothetical protein